MHRFNNKETPRMDILFLSLSLTVLSCTPIGKPQNPYGLPPPPHSRRATKERIFCGFPYQLSLILNLHIFLSIFFFLCLLC